MMQPERSAERDAALVAMLPHVGMGGWTVQTLTDAAGPDADLLFPGGPVDMVEAYCDLADRWMVEDAAALSLDQLRLPQRVRAVIAARLTRNEPYKEAIRRALGVLALPGRGMVAARCTARTVDAIWHAAGDRSADFSWYTKRAILAGVYGSTLLFWLREGDEAAALAFLDRRLGGLARFGRLKAKAAAVLRRN